MKVNNHSLSNQYPPSAEAAKETQKALSANEQQPRDSKSTDLNRSIADSRRRLLENFVELYKKIRAQSEQ